MQQSIQVTPPEGDVENGNVSKEGPPPAYSLHDTAPSVGAFSYDNPNYANYTPTPPNSLQKSQNTDFAPGSIQIGNLRCAAIFVLIFCIIPCINTLVLFCCVLPVILNMWPKIHICEEAIRNGDHAATVEAYLIAKRAVLQTFIVGVFAWIVSIGLTCFALHMYGLL